MKKMTGRTDTASKVISADPAAVFAAFRDGDTLMRWLPPKNMEGRALDYDFRDGGHYRIELSYRDGSAGKTSGSKDVSTGEFLDIVLDRRIRQSVRFESDDPALAEGMTMTWAFDPAPDGTTVTVTAEGVPAAIRKDDHLQGLNASLDNLARFVSPSD